MHFAIIGAGAVGGYYGALLARSGQQVSFVARGAHLEAIRAHGLRIESGAVGDFVAKVRAESDPARIGHADVVVIAVKTYDNATAIPLALPMVGPQTTVLTIQNGVDSAEEVARVVGEARTIAGATYIATAIEAPGLIRQTGTHRRVVFGEVFGPAPSSVEGVGAEVSPRVRAIETAMKAADIHAEAVADARVPIWEKFVYLAPFAAFTGAARLPIGPIWSDSAGRTAFLQAVGEVAAVARASGVGIRDDILSYIESYVDRIPPATRSSLLIDLSQGKRIEVESLPGSVVRRGRAVGVPTPMMEALYAALKPHTHGASS
jgi:2-dehydropantoate 2-reductase